MDLNALLGNWRTTTLAVFGALVNQLGQVGAVWPQNSRDWGITLFNALLIGLGWQAKDANVGSRAGGL